MAQIALVLTCCKQITTQIQSKYKPNYKAYENEEHKSSRMSKQPNLKHPNV